jgi:hypothetical protein
MADSSSTLWIRPASSGRGGPAVRAIHDRDRSCRHREFVKGEPDRQRTAASLGLRGRPIQRRPKLVIDTLHPPGDPEPENSLYGGPMVRIRLPPAVRWYGAGGEGDGTIVAGK